MIAPMPDLLETEALWVDQGTWTCRWSQAVVYKTKEEMRAAPTVLLESLFLFCVINAKGG